MSFLDKLKGSSGPKLDKKKSKYPAPPVTDEFATAPDAKDHLPDLIEESTFSGNADQPYRKTSRLHAIVNVFLTLCILACLVVIVFLTVNKPTEVVVLQWVPEGERWVRIVRPERSKSGLELYTQKAIEEYVQIRESMIPNLREMRSRWGQDGPLQVLSSPIEFQKFRSQEGPWKLMRTLVQLNQRRDIVVSTVRRLGSDGTQTTWRVNFEAQMYLTDGTKKGPQELFQVDIVIGYANTKVLEKNGHINPFGLSVNSYSLRKLR